MILLSELKMATYRVDKRREEVADYTDRKLKELQAQFAGEVARGVEKRVYRQATSLRAEKIP